MKGISTKLGGLVSSFVLVAGMLAVLIGPGLVMALPDANPIRWLPATVAPGDEFEVTVTFTSPGDAFNAIGLSDLAPTGWSVSVNAAWTSPMANVANKPADGEAAYIWFGPYDAGVNFTAVYKVQVPPGADPGTHVFPGGTLEYFVGAPPAHVQAIGGDYEIVISTALSVSLCHATPDPTKVGYSTSFNVTVSGGVAPYSYDWDFGDENSSTDATPTHTYAAANTYNVTVTVTDFLGNEDECSFELVVSPPLSLSACGADPAPTKVGHSTDFSVVVTGGIGPYSYGWDFGDENNSTDATPTHTYATANTYNVTVTVTDFLGNEDECSFELVVNPPLSISDCQADPDPTNVGYPTSFNVSVFGGVGPYSYDWDFGAGNSSTDATPTHTYAAANTYNVTVTVTDSLGNKDECSFELVVVLIKIEGEIRAVNCDILSGVAVTLYQNGTMIAATLSDGLGAYELAAPEFGDYRLVASKEGFRNEEQNISITGLTTAVDFVADHGLVPNAPDITYVLKCMNLWLFGTPPCQLEMSTVQAVINAWIFPAVP